MGSSSNTVFFSRSKPASRILTAMSAAAMLRRNLWVYGLGGIVAPFIGIKLIDMIIASIHLV